MFRIFLCSSLCYIEPFQLQRREHDLRQMKPRIYRRHPLIMHMGRARMRPSQGGGGGTSSPEKSAPVPLK